MSDFRLVVGCAAGADSFVRSAAPPGAAHVLSASGFGRGRASFAARSVAVVRFASAHGVVAFTGSRSLPGSFAPLVAGCVGSVCAASARPGCVAFPASGCPRGLVPAASWPGGFGSGTWATVALAAGLGLPVVVFPCGFSRLPSWGAGWSAIGSGRWAGGFRLLLAQQPSFF